LYGQLFLSQARVTVAAHAAVSARQYRSEVEGKKRQRWWLQKAGSSPAARNDKN